MKYAHIFWVILLTLLFLLPIQFAATSCSSAYFKSIPCADLNNNYLLGSYIYPRTSDGAWTLTGEFDWNKASNNLSTGLIAHYRLDDNNASFVSDSSGNGNTATVVNSASPTTGLVEGAYSFTNGYVKKNTLYVK